LDQGQQLFGVAMQKAIISDAAKIFWQNVLQNEPYEIFAFERAIAGFAGTNVPGVGPHEVVEMEQIIAAFRL